MAFLFATILISIHVPISPEEMLFSLTHRNAASICFYSAFQVKAKDQPFVSAVMLLTDIVGMISSGQPVFLTMSPTVSLINTCELEHA